MIDHVRDAIPAWRRPGDQVIGALPWSRLRRVAEHVQANLAGELRLAELSAVVHMSPYHFARLFKKSAGVSPRQFVIRRRIEAATILLVLADRQAPIGDVARAVGFRSQSHFTATFRRITGVTPGNYGAVEAVAMVGRVRNSSELVLSCPNPTVNVEIE
jgi:AraC-like DNA-binding protein